MIPRREATNSTTATFLRITGLRPLFIRYHRRRLQAAQEMMKKHGSDSQMPVWCSDRFRHHQGKLLALDHLIEKRFEQKHRIIRDRTCYRAFRDLICSKFRSEDWSFSTNKTEVIVTAPASQMTEWESFLRDFDRTET